MYFANSWDPAGVKSNTHHQEGRNFTGGDAGLGVNRLVFEFEAALYCSKCFEQVFICKNNPPMSRRTKLNEITGGKEFGTSYWFYPCSS